MGTEAISKSLSLLAVDDDEEVLKGIAFILKPYIKQIFTADNGKDAMRLFMKHKPDIVFVDIYLPSMNGVEITKKVKNLKPATSVAMISSNQDKEIFKSAINAGADYYIEKPFQKEAIREALDITSKKFLTNLHIANENRRLKLIFNSQNHLIAMTNGTQILNANKPFLDFFEMKSVKDREKFFAGFISPTGTILKKEHKWIDAIINLPVKILKLRSSEGRYKKYFPKIDFLSHTKELYLLTLTDVTDFEPDIKEESKQQKKPPLQTPNISITDSKKLNDLIDREIYRKNRYKAHFCIIKISFHINESDGKIIDKKNISTTIERIIKAQIRPTDIFEKVSDIVYLVMTPHTQEMGANILTQRLKDFLIEDSRLTIYDIDFKFSTFEHSDEISAENIFKKLDYNHDAIPSVKNKILSRG